jgi:hypothetical protein
MHPIPDTSMVGNVVLYTEQFDSDKSELPNIVPAIVVRGHADNVVDLAVFFLNGMFYKLNVPVGAPDVRGTWHPRSL